MHVLRQRVFNDSEIMTNRITVCKWIDKIGFSLEKEMIHAIYDEIDKQSRIVYAEGNYFPAISIAEVSRIFLKYGYEDEPPF